MLITPQHPLLFMHIPKTGGMSMFVAFCRLWGEDIADLYNATAAAPETALRAMRDPRYALYCGHYAFGLHEWMQRPAYYMSVVRRPVERIVSLYHYCLPIRNNLRKDVEKGKSLEQIFKNPQFPDYYRDFRDWILGDAGPETFLACPSADIDNGMVRRFSGYGLNPQPCPAEALARAKENIERYYSVVGVLERYADTLRLVADKFELGELFEHKVNTRPTKRTEDKQLAAADLARIEAMNRLDLELYDWVTERFEQELRTPGKSILVPAGGRTDYKHIKLWKAVGHSPLRDAAMEAKGLPPAALRKAPAAKPAQPDAHQASQPTAPIETRTTPMPDKTCQPVPLYAGVTVVNATPEEFMLDFCNRPVGDWNAKDLQPHARMIMSPYAAKRLAQTLAHSVKQYEQAYGVIETDVNKRRLR